MSLIDNASKLGSLADRRFGFIMPIGLCLAAVFSWYRGNNIALWSFASVALLIFSLAFFFPLALRPLRIAGEWAVQFIGRILEIIVFSVFFLCFFSPVALFRRCLQRDRIAKTAVGWVDIPAEENDPESLKRLY